jgi:hypothetical protein
MSSTFASSFRRRTIGRAASPPTWACYEQIPYDDGEYSDSTSEENSCSEDGEDYAAGDASDDEENGHVVNTPQPGADDDHAHNMQIDEATDSDGAVKKTSELKKDVKGKQRAIQPDPEPEPESPPKRHHRKKQRQRVYTLRPILTIQRSQGFVWNQVRLVFIV